MPSFPGEVETLLLTGPSSPPHRLLQVHVFDVPTTGAAFDWASPFLEKDDPILNDYEAFVKILSSIFDQPNKIQATMDQLYALKQGNESATTFVFRFKSLACSVPLDEVSLILMFRHAARKPFKINWFMLIPFPPFMTL